MPRVRIEYRSCSKEVYEKFCTTHPEVKITFEEWKKILYTFNTLFRDYTLETGERVKMPNGLGYFAINKKKPKTYKNYRDKEGAPYINLAVDWKKTRDAGTYIYHLNAHTSGYSYKWYWMNKEARFAYSGLWNFKPSRKSSRLLTTLLKQPNSMYAQVYKTWLRS